MRENNWSSVSCNIHGFLGLGCTASSSLAACFIATPSASANPYAYIFNFPLFDKRCNFSSINNWVVTSGSLFKSQLFFFVVAPCFLYIFSCMDMLHRTRVWSDDMSALGKLLHCCTALTQFLCTNKCSRSYFCHDLPVISKSISCWACLFLLCCARTYHSLVANCNRRSPLSFLSPMPYGPMTCSMQPALSFPIFAFQSI